MSKNVTASIKKKSGSLEHGEKSDEKSQPTCAGQAMKARPSGLRCHCFKLHHCYPLEYSNLEFSIKIKKTSTKWIDSKKHYLNSTLFINISMSRNKRN